MGKPKHVRSGRTAVLFLTQVLPYPLDAGPKVRAYYVLRHLARSHHVTLVSFTRPTDTAAAVEHLAQFCRAVHTLPMPRSPLRDAVHLGKSLVAGQPFLIVRDRVPAMHRLIQNLVTDAAFDVIHADQLWMAQYALAAQAHSRNPQTALVLDQHNACYQIVHRLAQGERNPFKRALLAREGQKMARYEAATCRRFDRVVWVTAQDYQAVQRLAAPGEGAVPNAAVIPICGDPESVPVVVPRAGARRVTFLGGLHYPPNAQGVLWFAAQVFPRVLAQVPDAILTVIGKEPPPALRHLAPAIPSANLDVTGYVADPRPYLAETAVFVVPLLAGGGMRVKIIDAWTWGLPVVSTGIGAEGIEIRPGENILIADTPEAFAQATVRLLQDPVQGRRLAQAGRRWAEQHYNWRTVYRAWDRIYLPLPRAGA